MFPFAKPLILAATIALTAFTTLATVSPAFLG